MSVKQKSGEQNDEDIIISKATLIKLWRRDAE